MNSLHPFILYSIKVAISLGILYLFYRATLSRLTFYKLNRWYLLVYISLSFINPFLHLTFLSSGKQAHVGNPLRTASYLNEALTYSPSSKAQPTESLLTRLSGDVSWQQVLLVVVLTGMVLMLTRFIIQLISLYRIIKHATLLSGGKIKIYHLPEPVIPFSFGNSIYINSLSHTDEELKEIIQHEMAHIRESHLADILFTQMILIFQWFNPFAWLLNKALRQNLEFLADASVISNGSDRKHYQYILLKVTGCCVSPLINPFNFSSLKKRIIMMNKNKTSRLNLLRLLLLLPVTVVMLAALQSAGSKEKKINQDEKSITTAGLILDAETLEPLPFVRVSIEGSDINTSTDDKGFYKFKLPYERLPLNYKVKITKDGYEPFENMRGIKGSTTGNNSNLRATIEFIGISKSKKGSFVHAMSEASPNLSSFNYNSVLVRFTGFKKSRSRERKLEELKAGNEKIFFIIDGNSYVTSAGSSASLDGETDIVFVNGKQMTAAEVNRTIQRKDVTVSGSNCSPATIAKYGKGILSIQTITGK